MSYYLYLPEKVTGSIDPPSMLAKYNLSDLREGATASVQCAVRLEDTPDETPGVVITWGQSATTIDGIEWTKATTGGYWIGVKGTPTPESMARDIALESEPVTLEDGQQWLVPIARMLPYTYQLNEDGEPIAVIKKKYQKYSQQALEYAFGYYQECLKCQEEETEFNWEFTVKQAMEFGVDALSFNYCINMDIASVLGLFGSSTFIDMLTAAASFSDDSKKKELSTK